MNSNFPALYDGSRESYLSIAGQRTQINRVRWT